MIPFSRLVDDMMVSKEAMRRECNHFLIGAWLLRLMCGAMHLKSYKGI